MSKCWKVIVWVLFTYLAASTEVVSDMIDSFLVCALFVGIQYVSRQTQTTKIVYITGSYKFYISSSSRFYTDMNFNFGPVLGTKIFYEV